MSTTDHSQRISIPDIERRYSLAPSLSVRSAPSLRRGGPSNVIVGYAALFDTESVDLGGFTEIIKPGAFARTIVRGDDVRALVNHDPSIILARTRSGTLKLSEDARGLKAEIRPPDSALGNSYLESVRRGDLSQMSFSFKMIADHWDKGSGEQVRELREVKLFDVSIVAYPAYEETSVGVGVPVLANKLDLECLQIRLELLELEL